MIIIRPITNEDLDALIELARQTGFGLTTLPEDRELLGKRIQAARRGFDEPHEQPEGETYLFVMEDTDTGKVVGTTGIVSKVGGFEPFYAYEIQNRVHESEILDVRKEVKALHLVAEHNGPCEVGSLFLSPEYRCDGNGRLLSLSRFLFMAQFPQRFDPTVIAELRGKIDPDGGSPFWDAIGKHFFETDFPKADYLSMVNKRFIAELMPQHPIYIPLLAPSAQEVIGEVHEDTRPARRLLEREGFKFNGMVDIFEAGPLLSCPRDKIRAVRESRLAEVAEITADTPDGDRLLVSNTSIDFRACQAPLQIKDDNSVAIAAIHALALKLKVGDSLRYVSSRPS